VPPTSDRLLADLEAYLAVNSEHDTVALFSDLLRGGGAFFSREQPDHVTGSAVIADPGSEKVLLRYHSKLERWLQPGGHVEPGDRSVFETALREAREETGIANFRAPAGDRILDVDVHDIPPRFGMPAHRHYDVRFFLLAPAGARASRRHRTRWFPVEKVVAEAEQSLSRAVRKARAWLSSSA
jgi:8-oxo-dGTP pyrophosphatase MutT (NUDIX family)